MNFGVNVEKNINFLVAQEWLSKEDSARMK